jgi:hypothetical protein
MKACSGKGLFFLVKECAIFVGRRIEENHNSVNGYFYGTVYVDKYGEEDPGIF